MQTASKWPFRPTFDKRKDCILLHLWELPAVQTPTQPQSQLTTAGELHTHGRLTGVLLVVVAPVSVSVPHG